MSDDRDQADTPQNRALTRRGLMGASATTAATGALLAATSESAAAGPRLRRRRERVVRKHIRSENEERFGETLETMKHPPRYEIIPTGDVFHGRKEVLDFYHAMRRAFPDQRARGATLRHADKAVIVEFYLVGTFLGPLQGFPPTGKRFKVRSTAFFLFQKGGAKIVTERVYFDLYTFLQQLGLLKLVADAGLIFPANGGIPISRRRK
jgi:steroid delta-isomerase-like uncharacterized protein